MALAEILSRPTSTGGRVREWEAADVSRSLPGLPSYCQNNDPPRRASYDIAAT